MDLPPEAILGETAGVKIPAKIQAQLPPAWRDFSFDALDVLHVGVRPALKLLGVRQETRHLGELELGLWRRFLSKDNRQTRPTGSVRRLVVIPGLGDSPFSWLGTIAIHWPILSERFDEIVWIDFPAFSGLLKRKRGFHSADALESAVFDVLDSLRPTLLMGHSLGGWLAASYARCCALGERPTATARRHYEGPDRLVLVDPAGFFRDDAHRAAWEGTFRAAREKGFEALRPALFHREPRWFKWLAAGFGSFLAREEVGQFLESVRESHFLTRGQLGEIKARTWVLWGAEDVLMGPGTGEAWVEGLAAGGAPCEGIPIARAGHGPHIEQPLEFAKQFKKILAAV